MRGFAGVRASPSFLAPPNALGAKEQAYEAYYWSLADYPDDSATEWAEDVQGITHDATNWVITQTDKVWKIPVSQDLEDVSCDDPGVVCKTFNDWPALSDYNHMGDPEYFGGFIFIPVMNSRTSEAKSPLRHLRLRRFELIHSNT